MIHTKSVPGMVVDTFRGKKPTEIPSVSVGLEEMETRNTQKIELCKRDCTPDPLNFFLFLGAATGFDRVHLDQNHVYLRPKWILGHCFCHWFCLFVTVFATGFA